MSDHRYRPEVEILSVTDTGRRRRWTDAQKVRIVEESFSPRGSMAETARRHDIGRTLLVRWRRQYRKGELAGGAAPLRFMPVTFAPPCGASGVSCAEAYTCVDLDRAGRDHAFERQASLGLRQSIRWR